MEEEYEVPELTVIGEANQVVMGGNIGGFDLGNKTAMDFEFEHD